MIRYNENSFRKGYIFMKKSKFLNVVSIIMIILGVFGIISGITSISSLSSTNEKLVELGMNAMPVWYPVFSIIVALVELAAGVVGVMYKSKDMVKIMGIVYLVVAIISWLSGFLTSVSGGMLGIVSLLFPILYLVGWKKSE